MNSFPIPVPEHQDHGVLHIDDLIAKHVTREEKPDYLWSVADLREWTLRQGMSDPRNAFAFLEEYVLTKYPRACSGIEATLVRRLVPAVRPTRVINDVPVWPREWMQKVFLRAYELVKSAPGHVPSDDAFAGHSDRADALLAAIKEGLA
jgi:hypothetical protein